MTFNEETALDFIAEKVREHLKEVVYAAIEEGSLATISDAVSIESALVGAGKMAADDADYLGGDATPEHEARVDLGLMLFEAIRGDENPYDDAESAKIEQALAALGFMDEDEFQYATASRKAMIC